MRRESRPPATRGPPEQAQALFPSSLPPSETTLDQGRSMMLRIELAQDERAISRANSSGATQTEAERDPADARHHEIDAEEQAEDIEARDRPMRQNQQAEHKRDHGGQQHQDPGRLPLHAEGKD